MKRVLLVVLVSCCLAAAALLLKPSDPYANHFESPIPTGSRMLHYQRCPAGLDISYAFVFEVADDTLAKQIIREWQLTASTDGGDEPTSFVVRRPPAWWPAEKELMAMPEKYAWTDKNSEQYRSLWVDRDHHRIYAECGQW